MKNEKGNEIIIVILVAIIVITVSVIAWFIATKMQISKQATFLRFTQSTELPTAQVSEKKPVQPTSRQQSMLSSSTPEKISNASSTQPENIFLDQKILDEISNWSNYKKFDNAELPVFRIEECSSDKAMAEYKLFIEKANRDIKKFELAKFGSYYHIDLYITPNYDKVEKYKSGCTGGLGEIYPVATYEDYIVWSWLACSAGAAPSPGDEEYNNFIECEKMAEALSSYYDKK
jgi:hypothetical protein